MLQSRTRLVRYPVIVYIVGGNKTFTVDARSQAEAEWLASSYVHRHLKAHKRNIVMVNVGHPTPIGRITCEISEANTIH